MPNKNGFAKNIEVYQEQFSNWWYEMRSIGRRLSKPSLNPRNREHFVPHVLAGILPETLGELNRVLGLAANIYIIYLVGAFIWNLLVRGALGFF